MILVEKDMTANFCKFCNLWNKLIKRSRLFGVTKSHLTKDQKGNCDTGARHVFCV